MFYILYIVLYFSNIRMLRDRNRIVFCYWEILLYPEYSILITQRSDMKVFKIHVKKKKGLNHITHY